MFLDGVRKNSWAAGSVLAGPTATTEVEHDLIVRRG